MRAAQITGATIPVNGEGWGPNHVAGTIGSLVPLV